MAVTADAGLVLAEVHGCVLVLHGFDNRFFAAEEALETVNEALLLLVVELQIRAHDRQLFQLLVCTPAHSDAGAHEQPTH